MPEMPRLVVVDTTPIIALVLIERLDLLRQLYGQVVAPSAVEAELLAGGPGGIGSSALRGATWLSVAF